MRAVHIATGAVPAPPTAAGAVEKIIYRLTRCLPELGCNVDVIDIAAEVHRKLETDVTYHEVWNPPLADSGFIRHVLRITIFAVLATLRLRRLVKSKEIDLIHTHSQFPAAGILAARKLFRWRIPVVHTTHNSYIVMRPTTANRLRHILEVMVFKKADHLIALTNVVAQQLVLKFGVDPKRITQIPNGVEVDDIFEFVESNPGNYSDTSIKAVLYPAKICPRKNQLALVQAIPRVLNAYPDTRFIFAGFIEERSYFDTISKFVAANNLSAYVQFTGELATEPLYKEYQEATVFVFPTLYETQGVVLLEAMAFGLPVVASRIGPIEDVVNLEEGSAILIDPNNPDDIADAIIRLLGDESLRQELSAKGKDLATHRFRWSQIAKETLVLYEKLVHAREGVSTKGGNRG